MPAVIDAPEVVEQEEYDLSEAQPQVRRAHAGFWRTLMQYMKRHSVHTPDGTPSAGHRSLHPIEMPMERLAREHPMLYLRVYTGL